MRRLWLVSELYYPEETSTGHIMTVLAEGLARRRDVSVLCAQPSYSRRGTRGPRREQRNAVDIHRVWSTSLDKDVMAFRLVNLLTVSLSMMVAAVRRVRRGDVVVVVTNPPLLPYSMAFACALRGARCVLYVNDLYPEILEAAGVLRRRSLPARVLHTASRWLLRRMALVITVGAHQQRRVLRKLPTAEVAVIPQPAEVATIHAHDRGDSALRRALGLGDRFVVQYAGNIGRLQGVDDLISAAEATTDQPDIHYLIVGNGSESSRVAAAAATLPNVTWHPWVERAQADDMHAAADVAVVSLIAGMGGVSVPSRIYSVLASGRPIIGVVEEASELGELLADGSLGWRVEPGDTEGLAAAIEKAYSLDDAALGEMSRVARRAAESEYSTEAMVERFADVLAGVG